MKYRFMLALMTTFLSVMLVQAQDTHTLPTAYDDVKDDYAEAVERGLVEGRAIIDLFFAEQFEEIHSRMAPQFQIVVNAGMLAEAYDQIHELADIGDIITERLLPTTNVSNYMVHREWGDYAISMQVAFTPEGVINGFYMNPVTPLFPDRNADYESEVAFQLPFDGLWVVVWGGDTVIENYHIVAPSQRYAYDLLIWKDGSTHEGDGAVNEDYYAFGQTLYAPADGEVISAVNDLPDVMPQLGSDPVNVAGNHVIIKVAEGEYLLIAHMQEGSVLVEAGDMVTAGQEIGRVGNSGNTTEPHIHIHLQDQPDFYTYDEEGNVNGVSDTRGLPLYFSDMLVNGEPVDRDSLQSDTFVRQQND